ncbi:MAG: Undecaprenyl-phosphate 4-deoxy-4-formamido-L-arabinose transferase [Alphaproteobacteria bacterium MarineAlpha5_Bin8]|nr:MAG: Undecaprenyl-phosphate 4-deoxy-4-formamido-L-arabinose transferase [Alphaproteobacteria bacterium MarineAlpha5_Bin8]PPR54146.1 MAG: Undecaprenyl-phosphate 4-deoxy-4-formamido-L-arabinose transferase [Alphaproteobacteria bacterium MarineAlpha5_Bin6]|tara:strand:+ start:1133 stop:1828 length:696 start_codon:yes stop_codon:yes gene_type:complete
MKKFSLVIPVFNEEKNIGLLFSQINSSLNQYSNFEIIFVDDASQDNTLKNLKKINRNNKNLVILENKKNLGQSLSIIRAIKNANSNVIITLDGDCQNDPNDIVKLYNKYISDSDLKLVAGIRQNRKDTMIKIISSIIANKIRNFFLKDNCTDTGCALKVFDKKIFLNFYEFDGIHRFLPALFNGYGYKVFFLPVNHRARIHGQSKYGTLKRAIKGISDIFLVKKLIKNNKN